MATTQFTVYSSNDPYAPLLTGQVGSLINLFDKCLVNGYGSKLPAGWLKPIVNDNTAGVACWQQPSGSGFVMCVNDNAPTSSAGALEAWFNGLETIIGLTASLTGIGSGYGQFPAAGQTCPAGTAGPQSGSFVIRKTNSLDAISHTWLMFADDRTIYFFTQPDTAGIYGSYFFGDIFSFKPTHDTYKCFIHGRTQCGKATTAAFLDCGDLMTYPINSSFYTATSQPQYFLARSFAGGISSVYAALIGDIGKSTLNVTLNNQNGASAVNPPTSPFYGSLLCANPTDNSLYMSPISVSEPSPGILRGRMRGMYHLCHPIANFGDGQIISGGNEYAGKTFMCVKEGHNGGMWVIEISNTVECNA